MQTSAADIGRAVWLEERRSGIGGTDAAAILGLSRWSTPFQIWLSKTRQGIPVEDNEPMWWGRELEDLIARRYMEKTGRKVWKPDRLVRHREHDCLIGSPDRLVIDAPLGLEIKTAKYGDEWGPDGSDEIPAPYVAQVAHYMAITGFRAWDVAVLIGGSDHRIYRMHANQEFEDFMIERLVAWWQKHIVERVEPEIDGHPGTVEWINRKWLNAGGEMLRADGAANNIADALWRARTQQEEAEALRADAEAKLKRMIGDNAGITGDGWKVTWKNVLGRSSTDWEAVAKATMDSLRQVCGEKAEREFAEHVANATGRGPGYRRFLFKYGD